MAQRFEASSERQNDLHDGYVLNYFVPFGQSLSGSGIRQQSMLEHSDASILSKPAALASFVTAHEMSNRRLLNGEPSVIIAALGYMTVRDDRVDYEPIHNIVVPKSPMREAVIPAQNAPLRGPVETPKWLAERNERVLVAGYSKVSPKTQKEQGNYHRFSGSTLAPTYVTGLVNHGIIPEPRTDLIGDEKYTVHYLVNQDTSHIHEAHEGLFVESGSSYTTAVIGLLGNETITEKRRHLWLVKKG